MLPQITLSQEGNGSSIEDETCESSAEHRTSVDVDAIAHDVRMRHRRVSVHHDAAMIGGRLKELVANPDQVVLHLMFKRNAWPDSSVHE
jgi:hypothetical protein